MKMMKRNGFTLIELLVAMAIASFVMAAIYSFYRLQMKQYRTQQMVTQMQQNMRAGMYLLEREIRMAGYSEHNPKAAAGFVANFASFGSTQEDSGAATDANNIAFTVDNNNDGAISADTSFEIIAFRLKADNNELQRWDPVNGWKVAAEQITALSFTYFRADGSPLTFPIDPNELQDIRSVEVALHATAGDGNEDYDMDLTNRIKCRNMGF